MLSYDVISDLEKEVHDLEETKRILQGENAILVKQANEKKIQKKKLEEEVECLKRTQEAYIKERKEDIYKEHRKVLNKITEWGKTHNDKTKELDNREKELMEEGRQLAKEKVMINKLNKDSLILKDKSLTAIKEAEDTKMTYNDKIDKIKERESESKILHRDAINDRDKASNMLKRMKKINETNEQLNKADKDQIKKDKENLHVDRKRIEIERIKIKDQWQQLLNAKNHLGN